MAKNVLRDIIGDKRKVVTMDDIEEAVAERFHLKISEMKSHRRSKTLVHPRQIAMYLCRELTNSSFPEIGRHFGGKDHTTIIHACKQIAKAKEADLSLRSTLESLTNDTSRKAERRRRNVVVAARGELMKLRISRDELLTGLQRVQGVVEKRNTMPILSNILLGGQSGRCRYSRHRPGDRHAGPLQGDRGRAGERDAVSPEAI